MPTHKGVHINRIRIICLYISFLTKNQEKFKSTDDVSGYNPLVVETPRELLPITKRTE